MTKPFEGNNDSDAGQAIIEETFTGVMESDVSNASTLEELKGLVRKKEFIEGVRDPNSTGIDEAGITFADDIIRNINFLEVKREKGEPLSDEDFNLVTRKYRLREKVKSFF